MYPLLLTVVCGIQLIKVLLPSLTYYLFDYLKWPSLHLAPLALATFGVSFFGSALEERLGFKRAIQVTGSGAAISLFLQSILGNTGITGDLAPQARLFLSLLGCASFGLFLSIAVRHRAFFPAYLLGIFLESALSLLCGTLDLAHRRDAFSLFVLFTLCAVTIWTFAKCKAERTEVGRFPAYAIGPHLWLQLILFQSAGRLGALTGSSLPWVATCMTLANCGSLFLIRVRWKEKLHRGLVPAAQALFLGSIVTLLWSDSLSTFGIYIVFMGASLAANVLLLSIWRSQNSRESTSSWAFGAGWTCFVIAAFLYYITFDHSLGFRSSAVAASVAGLFLFLSAFRGTSFAKVGPVSQNSPVLNYLPFLLWLPPIFLLGTWKHPTLRTENRDLRVMTYNIHQGFDVRGNLDLESIARVIEEVDPDVLALQEVDRGWLMDGSVDLLSWFSQRLRMTAYFNPTADLQWGNALLTRLPVTEATQGLLPPEGLPMRRGWVSVTVRVGGESIRVINTHLHHVAKDSNVRRSQLSHLLQSKDKEQKTLLVGDLNAEPESPEIALILRAGFQYAERKFFAESRPTWRSDDLKSCFDYIFFTPKLEMIDYRRIESLASDHLPLAATFKIL